MGNQCTSLNKSTESIEYKIWLNTDDENFIYPETLEPSFINKHDIGIALPGGGIIASTYSLGCLRALYQLEILQKTKYISSTSGSSWLIGPMSYMNEDDFTLGEFLGEYIKPADLTLEKFVLINKKSFSNNYYNYKSNPLLLFAINYFKTKSTIDKYDDNWTKTIAEFYFKKYKLDNFNLLPCMPNISDTSNTSNTCKLRSDVPFPIINGSVFFNDKIGTRPIEFTPMYYGLPAKVELDDKITIGSIYTEPIGFTSIKNQKEATKLTEQINKLKLTSNNNGFIKVQSNKPNNVISIAKQVGVSSAALAGGLQYYINNDFIYNQLNFPITNYYDPISNYFNESLKISDAGQTDDSSIISLLRRNVTKIIYCGNHSNRITYHDYFKSFFGLATKDFLGQKYELINNICHVFSNEMQEYNKLIKLIESKEQQNLPLVVQMNLKVLPNKLVNVKGNYTVSMLFIIASKNNWMDKLPVETLNYINENSTTTIIEDILENLNIKYNEFDNFPHTDIQKFNYSPALINAMTQIGTYDIMFNKEEILKFCNQ
jgi:hypothetical protein